MKPEKNNQKLTRWLLIATIALLVLVLSLQLWQIFGRKTYGGNGSLRPDSTDGPAAPQTTTEPLDPAAVSPGKAVMIEDIRALNADLPAGDLARLSAEELEQLWKAGAPGLPIGMSAAAQAAEEYAGTLAVDAVTSETDPELDESPAHYEVELRHPTMGEFSYKIDAYTGAVLEGTPDIMRDVQSAAAAQGQLPATREPSNAAREPASDTQTPSGGEEAAKSAAFAHAGISAADAVSVRCELDWEDGRQVYDIEFWAGDTEYDYKIDASTSAVIEAGQEMNHHHSETPAQPSGGCIGEEAAKNAALTHAGVSAADAGRFRCELDEEDGRLIYEIEFRTGNTEYDYEIDASSGAVLKAEQDR